MIDQYRGVMMGVAAGDTLGTMLEFTFPGRFEPITDMVGAGLVGLDAGQWTDDTSMALFLAESLVEQQAFDPEDQCVVIFDGTCKDLFVMFLWRMAINTKQSWC